MKALSSLGQVPFFLDHDAKIPLRQVEFTTGKSRFGCVGVDRWILYLVFEQELGDAAARADRTGTFACPHTGVALASLFKLVEAGVITRGHRVVVISTASGLKFAEFKTAYHQGRLTDVEPHWANQPVELEATEERSWRAIAEFLDRSA